MWKIKAGIEITSPLAVVTKASAIEPAKSAGFPIEAPSPKTPKADKSEELHKSQESISELNDKIGEIEKNEKRGVVKDDSLGIYSSYFMSSFISDAHKKKVDVSVAIIGASYRNRYNKSVWNEFLTYVKTGIPENYIFGILNSGHLAMLGVECEYSDFKNTKQKVT